MACADAVDKNHKLIVCAEKAAGANFVVIDNPAGDKQTSPITINKKLRTNQIGLTKSTMFSLKHFSN
ncbi:hypothetical protein BAU27_27835 [Bacillus sp. NH11B]|nr:hypothetical protein BAU27_27835 [Bacillus sp. NH11B]